jgi:DNA-binding NarL/FixJ family response regulator
VLTMTYGLLYRMQSLKGEQDMRQLEMRIFMDRQEAFTARAKTEKLVEDLYLENLIMQYDLDGFEIKLLQYISEGKTNAVIAKKMKTTVEEIEDRTKDLYQKLDIAEHIREDEALLKSQPDYLYN